MQCGSGDDEADGRPELRERAVDGALADGGVLGREEGGAAPLAPEAEALAEAIGDAVTNYRKALAPKPAGLLSIPTSVLSDEPSKND
jgi:hypothetical protein